MNFKTKKQRGMFFFFLQYFKWFLRYKKILDEKSMETYSNNHL